MNLSMKWLADYVTLDPSLSMRDFSEAMTMSGSKVETYETEGTEISHVVVGKVLSVVPHQDSDHLVVCQIDVAQEAPLQIVTGAQNVVPGALVPVALHGSTLPGGVKIKKGKLRGVESNGMLCSLKELGLTVNDFPYAIEDGIFLLEEDCSVGEDIHTALGLNDTSVEFEITSNRPDCLSVLGLAREVAATFQKDFRKPSPQVKGSGGDIGAYLSVEVKNPQLCQRYMAKVVRDVRIGPSPRWMRERLRASGVRPINNLVDITNYVMLEYGQPMHAFDLDYVKGGKIIVRNAEEGETITTLDGMKRKLSPEMLVIADKSSPSAVAGVMGGEYSGIGSDTHTVVFESACFLGSSVRLTARKLGMRTESSGRFEKGLDPHTCLPALLRACELVEQLGAGHVVNGMIDIDHNPQKPLSLNLESDWINTFLGIQLSKEKMISILEKLEFTVNGNQIIPPSFRTDIVHKADVAEEIARFYGYNHIPTTHLSGVAEGKLTEEQKFEKKIVDTLVGQGLYEVSTYSFISPKYYDKIRLPQDSPLRKSVVISNPLGEDTSIMRTTTVPSILEVLSRNYNNRNSKAHIFEIATEYIPQGEDCLPLEKQAVTIGMYGETDFFQIKGVVEVLLETLRVKDWEIAPDKQDPSYHPGRTAKLSVQGKPLGVIAQVHPAVAETYGIHTEVYIAVLELEPLFAARSPQAQYTPLPKFPAVTRDLALLCDQELPVLTMEKAIRQACGSYLEQIELFDVYQGKQIAQGKKSVAYTLRFRCADKTLTDQDADAAMKRALKALEALHVSIRE